MIKARYVTADALILENTRAPLQSRGSGYRVILTLMPFHRHEHFSMIQHYDG